ncbi:MAG: hypothetical protein GY774_35470 [Planctomycetes bacterium]|nr:hypothetical protein [Planctomycetota bacterium]
MPYHKRILASCAFCDAVLVQYHNGPNGDYEGDPFWQESKPDDLGCLHDALEHADQDYEISYPEEIRQQSIKDMFRRWVFEQQIDPNFKRGIV